MKNGLEEFTVIKDNKTMRFGYTTGSCAAAAAQAAATMLFSGEDVPAVKLETPKGIILYLEPEDAKYSDTEASCAIRKDAGDDPDVTNGVLVYATVRKTKRTDDADPKAKCIDDSGPKLKRTDDVDSKTEGTDVQLHIHGGQGVGLVTKPGLEQPVGEAAINHVPREMITVEVTKVCREYGYFEGLDIEISVPGGDKIAKQTFNPILGIEGGISILGTSGIVEPMSERALVASIEVEMKQKSADGRKYLLVTPGNYGTQYLKDNFPFGPDRAVKCSNYVGQTLDMAVNMGLEGLLFVAHIGKFVKVAGGIMNTHSKEADCRMEILASSAIKAGASAGLARKMLTSVTTDDALKVIYNTPYWDKTLQIITDRIAFYLDHRTYGRLQTGAIIFSNVYGELGRTANVADLIEHLQK